MDRFQRVQPELEITARDRYLVRVAGLCHDIGHGPFSHVFDGVFMKRVRPEWHYHHEQMSIKMLDWLIEDNQLEVEKSDVVTVKRMIMASEKDDHEWKVPGRTEKKFLYDIVANGRNSIDVDKFDYLARDVRACGISSAFDHRRLMVFSRVIDDQICFSAKEASNVYQLFQTRFRLHRQVYTHRAAKAIEYMIADALVEADIAWGGDISASVKSAKEFEKLTDSILRTIESSDDPHPNAAKSRGIIRRMRRRQLYRFVDEVIVPGEMKNMIRTPTAEEIATFSVSASCAGGGGSAGPGEHGSPASSYSQTVSIAPEDIIVDNLRINFCNKEADPTETVRYFHKSNPGVAFAIEAERVGSMLPSIFEERIIRVFSRKRDEETVRAVAAAFRCWWTVNGGKRATPHPASRVYNSPARGGGGGSSTQSPRSQSDGSGTQLFSFNAPPRSHLVPPAIAAGADGIAQGLMPLKRRRTDDEAKAQ